ncbi:prophage Lp2 protein 26 [Lactiplantibacillus plantarum]|uniref:YopX family protein n=1 Tax=Lactiplantibacillus plantarum TaxID=1590 RepID=UPI000B57D592|nr:YopX family protein [Lactiplantibacillus plantarum]MCG0592342.1 prophage Lp2 protein 26 [Lactiplantibacillus plantarum]MCG0670995.1 prophage Lp2 protein 26 [Lactiplantibacillus plantarum]MCG0872803.1 prophage Lp2 protein 26 [Lactiplantibacillus plantarum]MCG0920257.1 prophage Lp2 protein 26 [Lactiplantibacillus plantarum]OUT02669.1 SPBc2 prophage-derived uncharacterized protein YopX [Lactiplantibacillus plantarum]
MATMIKFRAWDKVQNKMLLPDNIEFIHGQAYWAEASTDGQDECSNDGKVDGIGALFELEQFTGLTDVNGNEIYENDIIVSRPTEPILGSPKIGVVKLSKVSFSWCCETGNNEYNIWKTDKYRTYEVIGNVHANPELLVE